MEISAYVKRGKNAGTILYPHRHKDGAFVVSMTRFERDYIRVGSLTEVAAYAEKGYSVRMSNEKEGIDALVS